MHKLSLACLLLFCFSQVAAKEVAGVSIAEQIQREADHAELVLNGAGVRKKFFFKILINYSLKGLARFSNQSK